MKKNTIKKRTLNELRQVKTYGYRPPSPSRKKVVEDKNEKKQSPKGEQLYDPRKNFGGPDYYGY